MGGSVLYRPSAAVALLLLGLLIGCGTADVQEFGPELHACRADADCTLVYTDVCGGIGAIHVEFVKAWNEHMDIERAKHRGVVCEPAIPIENFEAGCVRDRCVALDRYHRAILSLSDKPLVAQPVTLTLHFRFLDDAPEARAWFDLPEGIALLDGSLAWQGSLRSGDEGVLAVEIQVARPGYYQLKGIAQAETTAHGFEVRDTLDVEVTTNDAILGSKPENLWYDPDNPLAFPAVLDHELVEGHMALTPKPALNQVLTLTYRITPWVDLADPARNYMTLELPPRAFEIVDVKFPEGGRPTRTSSPGAAASKRATRLSSRWPLR